MTKNKVVKENPSKYVIIVDDFIWNSEYYLSKEDVESEKDNILSEGCYEKIEIFSLSEKVGEVIPASLKWI